MLHELFESQRHSLNHFFDKIDHAAAEKIFQKLKSRKGLIFLTGIGKSAFVAKKVASTMTSTGTRAFFLDPVSAMHGDIGIVSKDDILLMISKSGESDELLQMVPSLHSKGGFAIAIVNNGKSRLARACDLSIELPLSKELCPFDLVPTTSAVTQLLFGDVLAIALLRDKNFTLDEYAMNHPAGRIGKRLTLRVNDLMLKDEALPLCRPPDKLFHTLVELSNKKCGCVLITDDELRLQGIFTDGDLRRALQKHGPEALDMKMGELMTPTARHIMSDEMASHALSVMESDKNRPITVLPVLCQNKKVVGLIKMHDIVQSGL